MRTRSWPDPAFLSIVVALWVLPGLPVRAAAVQGPPPALVVPAETSEARQQLIETVMAPVRDASSAPTRLVSQDSATGTVQFRTYRQGGSLYLVFANPVRGGYPLDGAGTCIIKRSLADGSFQQMKIFVQDGPGTFLRAFPDGDRTVLDAWLAGEPFQTGIVIPVTFDRVLTAPLSSIIDWTSGVVDWSLLLAPAPSDGDRRLEAMVGALGARLPGLRDMDDGAMDAAGRMVFIATGEPAGKGGFNCSGFAKWVVDGFFAPLAGHPMPIDPLKSRDTGHEHTWSARFEEELDPWFGLDWSRGLARAAAEARTGVAPSDDQIDVRDSDRVAYIRDVGYPVSRLAYVLYFLARRDPGTFYVGSVNAPSARAVSEGTPTLRQHHHVIVVFPYFDRNGVFQVTVMERNLRTSLASLQHRYGTEYVHLERISSEGVFAPPKIE